MNMEHNAQLNAAEMQRYARQIAMPHFGVEGQKKLKRSSALVIGAGGLGSPALLYLAAAGVGKLGFIDFDAVDATNLQRQIIFAASEAGLKKTKAAENRLSALNPEIVVCPHNERLTSRNALSILKPYDVVIDGSDNFATRYLANDACYFLEKPLVYGSAFQWEGQFGVFNLPEPDGGRTPNYRDVFPEPPEPAFAPSCAEGGILGAVTGVIGALQAAEAVKILTGAGRPAAGRVVIYDALSGSFTSINVHKDPANPVSGQKPRITELIDYDAYCGATTPDEIRELSPTELRNWMKENKAFQLLDVRNADEYVKGNIGGELVPLNELRDNLKLISTERPVVAHCQSGARSRQAAEYLLEQGFDNVYNLSGGYDAWRKMLLAEKMNSSNV